MDTDLIHVLAYISVYIAPLIAAFSVLLNLRYHSIIRNRGHVIQSLRATIERHTYNAPDWQKLFEEMKL